MPDPSADYGEHFGDFTALAPPNLEIPANLPYPNAPTKPLND